VLAFRKGPGQKSETAAAFLSYAKGFISSWMPELSDAPFSPRLGNPNLELDLFELSAALPLDGRSRQNLASTDSNLLL
jgi:hypothetical protein